MEIHSPTRQAPQTHRSRKRVWVVAVVVVLGLGVYAASLSWVTGFVEADVLKSIRPLPAAIEDSPGQPE